MTTINKRIKVKWKNPYIEGGLLTMFDGEWNASGPRHCSDTTQWTDIAGRSTITTTNGRMTIGRNLVTGTFIATIPGWRNVKLSGEWTVEIFARNVLPNYFPIIDVCSSHTSSALIRESNALILSLYGGEQRRNHRAIYDTTKASITASGSRWRVIGANGATFTGEAGMTDVGDDRIAFGRNIVSDYRYGALSIHSIRIYSRALSDAEIAANSSIDLQRFCI